VIDRLCDLLVGQRLHGRLGHQARIAA
jgi:hypothetical protein